jgi:Spy/CpxP family protein refolding chaperone
MKRSTKIIGAVVMSISLVTAAGAYATKKGFGEKRLEFITSYISSELELNDAQQQQLSTLGNTVMSLKQELKAQGQPLHSDIDALLKADKFDQQKALQMIEAKTAYVNQSAPEVIAALGNFLDGLNPEQKAEVLEFLEHKRQGKGHWGQH